MLSELGHPPVCLNRDLKFFRSQLCLGFNINADGCAGALLLIPSNP